MLPAKNGGVIHQRGNNLYYTPNQAESILDIDYNLYVISGEDVKLGCPYFTTDKRIVYWNEQLAEAFRGTDCQKPKTIIATTDKNLGWNNLGQDEAGIWIGNHVRKGQGCNFQPDLPGIPDEFLQKYCSKQGIDKVLVEYVELNTDHRANWEQKFELKIKKGSIITKENESKIYSEEEVVELLKWLKHIDNGTEHYNPFNKKVSESIGFSPLDCFIDNLMTEEELLKQWNKNR